MPKRNLPLVTDQIYHVYNKTIYDKRVFKHKQHLQRALETFWFYRFQQTNLSLSKYKRLNFQRRVEVHNNLIDGPRQVTVFAYALMPNHFHLLIRQEKEQGISKYLADLQNSFTKYINQKHTRLGPLFLPQFKAVRIESDEQFLHIFRYIIINPLTSYLLKNFTQLKYSPLTSLYELTHKPTVQVISQPDEIINHFANNDSLFQFLSDQISYQRELAFIKNLLLEEE